MLAVVVGWSKSKGERAEMAKQCLQKIHLLNKHLIFRDIVTFLHVEQFCHYFQDQLPTLKKYLIKCLHSDPSDLQLRKCLLAWLLSVEKVNNLNVKRVKNVVDYRIESGLMMNQDELASKTPLLHKKNAILNNVGDKNAWIGFVSHRWTARREAKWIEVVRRLLQVDRSGEGSLTESSKAKGEALLTEMVGWKMLENPDTLGKDSKAQEELMAVFKLQLGDNSSLSKTQPTLKVFYNLCSTSCLRWWPNISTLPSWQPS